MAEGLMRNIVGATPMHLPQLFLQKHPKLLPARPKLPQGGGALARLVCLKDQGLRTDLFLSGFPFSFPVLNFSSCCSKPVSSIGRLLLLR